VTIDFQRVIFSGINGPLGFDLANQTRLDERFFGFSSRECDLRNQADTLKFFSSKIGDINPSRVAYLHFAAVSGGSEFSKNFPATTFVENLIMAINAVSACRDLGVRRVILTLSTACYSEALQSPSENLLHEGSINSIDYAYAYAKRMQEVLMRSFNQEFGMKISSVLVNGIIGPKMKFKTGSSILPASLIRDLVIAKEKGERIEIDFDDRIRREYSYSHDLARAILWCLEFQKESTLLNIGDSKAMSIKSLISIIANTIMVPDDLILLRQSRSSGRLVQSTSNADFLNLSKFSYTPIEVAIKSAVDWYLESRLI
jgi:nucleoside-diphosphate-sugar epimerase